MIDYEVEALASMLGPGQHTGLACPQCRHPTDRALSLLVDPPSVKAICHRASCGFKYVNSSARWESVGAEVRPTRARPYTGPLSMLDEDDIDWFRTHFRLPLLCIKSYRKSDNRYFLPIGGPERQRGWLSRRPWEGAPLVDASSRPKALIYMDNDDPAQHWECPVDGNLPLILVEDPISSARILWDTDLPAVALLGTGINQEKIAEMQRHVKSIVFALDADATGQAFAHARKWGQAFESCRVLILERDIKDETIQAVKKIFAPFAPT